MSWANEYIKLLSEGYDVQFRPHGNSMQGMINSGQMVTLKPVRTAGEVGVNNIVLCAVDGKQWLHLITGIRGDGKYQISNNKGHVNGWTDITKIYGVVTNVQD